VEATAIERPVAQRSAKALVDILRERPTDVAAADALAGIVAVGPAGLVEALLSAVQAFDDVRCHVTVVGTVPARPVTE
jgi:hypothetical protein